MIIIDSNNLCYAAYFKTAHLSYGDKRTGIIFGFLMQLYTIARKFKDNRPLVFAWDSRKKLRKALLPTYKGSRKSKLTKEDYAQFKALREKVLPELGFKNNFLSTGYEADDVIASICLLYSGEKVIVSSDTDLYQLLDKDTMMFKSQSKQTYTARMFEKDYDIEPKMWALVKGIAGCSTDEVPGMKGVGEKTAIKFLNRQKVQKRFNEMFKNGEELVRRNLRLVALPFDGDVIPYKVKFDEQLSLKGFYNICEGYGFRNILKEADEWIETFNLR